MPLRRRFRQQRDSKDKISDRGREESGYECRASLPALYEIDVHNSRCKIPKRKFSTVGGNCGIQDESSLCSSRFGLFLYRGIFVQRQPNRESRALTRLTLDGNPAAVGSDNFIANGKTETQSTSLLRGEKGLENLRRGFRVNAIAGIRHGDGDSIS
jgi:hypothetical protein